MFKKKKALLIVAVAMATCILLSACGSGTKSAQYPTKPINLVVPYAAGGSSDLTARAYSEALSKELGQPVVIVTKPGAGGAIGSADVARQKPDGYNLLNVSIGLVTIIPFTADVGYDDTSFTPIAQVVDMPLCLAVAADSPIKNLKDYVEYAQKNPGKVRFGNPGAANIQRISIEDFALKAKLKLVSMPYEGAPAAVAAMLGGHIESAAVGVPDIISQVKSGTVRIIGISSEERISMLPDVPTFREQGFDVVNVSWYGVLGPKNMDRNTVKVLADALKKVHDNKQVQDAWGKMYLIPKYRGPEEFGAFIEKEKNTNRAILKQIGLEKKK